MRLPVAPVILALAAVAAGLPAAEPGAARRVMRIDLHGKAITPVTERFVTKAIRTAGEKDMTAVVLVLDTPGGLVDATRGIVKSILGSRVPVVVYVAPAGARAASAGTFITMAGHVAAMAPGTTIGAAHPVSIGGLPGTPSPSQPRDQEKPQGNQEPVSTPVEQKTLNDTVSWARSLAEMRGRNAEWMAEAVRSSVSVSASDALEQNVVDLIAEDFPALLRAVDQRQVRTASGEARLQTAGVDVVVERMWWGERFLAALASPTLAFLLLVFGIYGVIFELYTPGWGVPGTVGVVCLMLCFFALAILPTNFVGLALLLLAMGMLVAEAFVASYGLLTLGGVVCLVTGGLMLVDSPAGFMRVSLWALIPVTAAVLLVSLLLVTRIVRAQRLPAALEQTTAANPARAVEEFAGTVGRYKGVVRFHGELWNAESPHPVQAGQDVRVVRRDGLLLQVSPGTEPPVIAIGGKRRQTAQAEGGTA